MLKWVVESVANEAALKIKLNELRNSALLTVYNGSGFTVSYLKEVTIRTGPEFWYAPTWGVWDGSEWDSQFTGIGHDIDLIPNSPWVDGFRPKFIKVTHNSPFIGGIMLNADLNKIVDEFPCVSGTWYATDFSENKDISKFTMTTPLGAWSWLSIEFR